jgi:type IV pilus assembly protein PilX
MNKQAMTASKHYKESMYKLIPFMVRLFDKALLSVAEGLTAHHERGLQYFRERNQQATVRPEPVEGLNQTSRVGNVFLPTLDDDIFLLPQAVGKKACPPYDTAILHGTVASQSGAVLIISLIMLLLLTLIGTTGMQSTSLEEKMAGNMRDKNLAFQAAESALSAAEATLFPVPPVFDNPGTGGFYSAASTIPTPAAIMTDGFWANGLAGAPPTVATSTVNALGNGIVSPVYIIQELASACYPSSTPDGICPAGEATLTPYRITVRATGGSTNTVVILQSIYSRP